MYQRKKVRLLVVDERDSYCEFIRNSAEIWHCAYELECEFAGSAKEAFEKIADWCPTIIMLDAHMPDMNCINFIQMCKEGQAPLVVTSEHPSSELRESVIAQGAIAYVSKTADPDELDEILGKLAWIASGEGCTH